MAMTILDTVMSVILWVWNIHKLYVNIHIQKKTRFLSLSTLYKYVY